jgi:hypothetical protein
LLEVIPRPALRGILEWQVHPHEEPQQRAWNLLGGIEPHVRCGRKIGVELMKMD